MNDSNPGENPWHSWTPRRPSRTLKGKIFSRPAPDKTQGDADLLGSWRWLMPALGCLLVLAGVFNPGGHERAAWAGADTNNLLAIMTTQRSYAAYAVAGFHSRQNAVGADTLEWTTAQGLTSSVGSFPAVNTNSLIR